MTELDAVALHRALSSAGDTMVPTDDDGRRVDRDAIDESSQESFPASDPPSWTSVNGWQPPPDSPLAEPKDARLQT